MQNDEKQQSAVVHQKPRYRVEFQGPWGTGHEYVEFYTLHGAMQWIRNEIAEGRLKRGQAKLIRGSL